MSDYREPLKTGSKRENRQSASAARKADDARLYALLGGLTQQTMCCVVFPSNKVFRGDLYMKISAITRCGSGKSESDDRILVGGRILCCEEYFSAAENPCAVGISDGVGGNDGGNIAAQYICERLYGVSSELDEIAGVNRGLLALAQKTPGKEKMAATYSGIFPAGKLFHIGNTRVYAVQGGYLKQLTRDMTTYNYYISLGRIQEAEQCSRSEITACFGGGTTDLFKPQLVDFPFSGSVLMTSDGVHDFLDIDCLEEIISAAESDISACREILDRALEAGSEDDMSVVLARL